MQVCDQTLKLAAENKNKHKKQLRQYRTTDGTQKMLYGVTERFTLAKSDVCAEFLTVGAPAETLGSEPPRKDPNVWLLIRRVFLAELRSGVT